MPRISRCCKTGWWPGQHHRGSDRRHGSGPAVLRAITALTLTALLSPLNAESLLHIRVVEGDGAIHPASTRSARGIVVEISDETGKPVNQAAVSFRLPDDGPGATFGHGMKTEIATTGPDGRTGIHELITGRIAGPFQIRVTAAKDTIRAGTVIDQYISERTSSSPVARPAGSRRWILWTALAGGAAAAGLAAGMARGSSASVPAAAAPVPVAPPSIGTPVFTIGRPQ